MNRDAWAVEPEFDWYTASIPTKPEAVIDALAGAYELSDVQPSTPKMGYERAYKIIRGETVLARVQFGGPSVGLNVWACASGDQAPEFARVVRTAFPAHGLLRADVKLDYDEPGAWDSLAGLAIGTADQFRLKVKHHGDFHREQDGRTLELGSRSSVAFQRIYEKGKQLGQSPDWVRAELELKPQNHRAKALYASASPEQVYMATKWSRHLYEVLNGPTAALRPAPAGRIRKKTDDERALEFMGKQYAKPLLRLLESVGGDIEAFGLRVAGLIPDQPD